MGLVKNNVLLDTLNNDSNSPWEKRGIKYRKRNNHTMATYAWSVNRCFRKKVIDIGCGKGDGMSILSIFTNELWGIDFNYKELRYATRNNYYCPVRIMTLNVDKEWLLEDVKFDVAICFETLEHLYHPEILLKNLSKSCQELIFSVPHNAPAPFHHQVFHNFEEVKSLVEPYFKVTWFMERKGIISQEPFNVPHRYIGIGTPK